MKLKHTLAPALVAGALTLSGSAMADQATANLDISLKVIATCTINAATFAFTDQVVGFTADVSGNVPITVKCATGTPYKVGFGNGVNSQGTQRRLANGSNYINYQLYTSSTYTDILDMDFTGTKVFSGAGTGSDAQHIVYARAVGTPGAPIGDYADQVVMTIDY